MKLNEKIEADAHVKKYYKIISEKTECGLDAAKKAKEKGFDVRAEIETTPALDLADRTETIIGPKGISKRYREVMEEMNNNREKTIFKIFRELIDQEWCKIEDPSKRIEQAIKTALVLNTEGVVVAPIDGVPKIQISENPDGSKFIDIYYAGPIRAAGGTSAVLPLILGDYARVLMGLERYKPTEDEIERYVEECQIYEEIFSRQYKLTDDEVRKIIRGCPVCINGEPTETREVSVHRDLRRVPDNRVRGGMCLVISEGVALKAMKILKFSKMLELDWSWLEGIIKVGKSDAFEKKIKPNEKYLTGTAAGRPIFAYPSKTGGFRLRYGRGRNMGIMGKGMSPATMHILDDFVAVGTQIKVERPGKAAGICPVDSIEGPIVRLTNGNVLKVNSAEEALRARPDVEKILFLGDLLVPVGDFSYSAHPLVPAGFCEEWWALELEKKFEGKKTEKRIEELTKNPNEIEAYEAVEISEKFDVPLHPKFLHYYKALANEEMKILIDAISKCSQIKEGSKIKKLEIKNNGTVKELLEKIGLPHELEKGNITISETFAYPLLKTFGLLGENQEKFNAQAEDLNAELSRISGIKIMDKGGSFIGARMGRPEASRPRKMVGNPHVIFPIGLLGGNTRSINKAMNVTSEKNELLEAEICAYECGKCGKLTHLAFCPKCNERTFKIKICPKCSHKIENEKCGKCGANAVHYLKRKINLEEIIEDAEKNLGIKMPELVKGVKGIINEDKVCEPIEKGMLRARHDLHIFRDGTIRYELINAPLTHFKPKEIGVSVETLRKFGYETDINGEPLESAEQMLELFPQDIIIHEKAGDFFVEVTKFVDELLEKFYKTEPLFRIKSREELVGELLLGLAPHTSAAIVGRVIGYTKARVCFAHPYFHQAKRRNIDGDQDSLMLLMDALLNFSHSYLPGSRGGRMDAPLVFTVMLNPNEIDEEVHEMESCFKYPIELYEKSQEFYKADAVNVERIKNRLGSEKQYSGFGYTHETSSFDEGPKTSRYVQLTTMEEKMKAQAKLQNSIAAVEGKDALERVLVTHFIPDIIGNARSFSRQNFRCTNCNAKYRRIPLSGKCTKCGKENIILTIAQGSVRKYLAIAKALIQDYELSAHLKQRIDLISEEIDSVFAGAKVEKEEPKKTRAFKSERSEREREEEGQKSLFEFV